MVTRTRKRPKNPRNQKTTATRKKKRGKPPANWKKKLCEHLAGDPRVGPACDVVGVHLSTYYVHREKDSEFATNVDDALARGMGIVVDETVRRGVHGVERGVYYKGRRIDTELHYSDALLARLLQAHDPRFREGFTHAHTGKLTLGDAIATAGGDSAVDAAVTDALAVAARPIQRRSPRRKAVAPSGRRRSPRRK